MGRQKKTITVTFEGEPNLPKLMRKVGEYNGTAFERLKPGGAFTTTFDDELVIVAMHNTRPVRLEPVTDRVPCCDEHAMALSDGIQVTCDFCR